MKTEASTLTHGEQLNLIRHCVRTVAGRVPVIAGTGSNCTKTAVELSVEAEKAGADGVLLVSPYYNKATQNGLYQHFKTVAEAIQIPALLYNVPGRTECNIQPETIVRLCREVKNIVGVKDAGGNISQTAKETQTLYAGNGDDRIYGIVYIPQDAGEQMPAVIYSHGFGGTHHSGMAYADILARNGYVVYCFDFRGGGPGSQSNGSMTEMSLLTEQSDLEAVITMIQGLSYVDGNRIVLLGESQGGAVSAVTSAVHQDEVAGHILLYPAFVMADSTRKEFDNPEDIPETYTLMGMTVGRRYAEDLLDYDFYEVIGQYDKDVLLLHGDSDRIVPVSYSERAVQVYPSAQLEIFSGSGHGFYGSDVEKASDYILGYLKEHFGQ